MTRLTLAAVLVAVVVLSACGKSTSQLARQADIYASTPSQADIRTLLQDDNWWAGVPSFRVLPLDAATFPLNEQFGITQPFLHLGTAEDLVVRYDVFDTTSGATTTMSDLKTAHANSPTTPKVGDDTLYTVFLSEGGAPFVYRTYVRVSQVIVTIAWAHRNPAPTVQQLSKNAHLVVDGLKKALAGKIRGSLKPVGAGELPPPGRDITPLGSTRLPIEAWVVMGRIALMDTFLQVIKKAGLTDFAFGDYALNNDTHMEVQTALVKFGSATDASDWASVATGSQADQNGIASTYLPTGGTPAAGEYHYVFAAASYGALLVCKPSLDGEAATRECEGPMERTALAWKIALGG
ncbi:MAG TPA: hypothetical protein VJP81_09965 [Candidatus Dormibacteraeota bacterium]|nr:hypothetical protein [Candidatus Dormibacteraeota bacterium]